MIIANMMGKKPSILWADVKILEDRLEAGFYKASDLEVLNRLLSSDQVKELGVLCNLITDGTHQTPDYLDRGCGVPFLTSKNITDEGIDFNTDNDISFDQHHQLKKTVPKVGDILMTKIGSRIGVAKVFPSQSKDCNIFVSLALLRPNPDLIDPYYLEVFLNSSYGSIQAYRLAKGITQLDFHLGDIKKIQVLVTRVEIQKYIGNKVRKAEEFREEAKQLRIKSQGKLNQAFDFKLFENIKSSKSLFNWVDNNYICTDRVDADYFKAEYLEIERLFVENKGRFQKLKDIAKLSKSRADLGNYVNSFLYLDISSLDEETGIFNKTEVLTVEAPSRAQKWVQTNDVLVSTVRPNRKGIGLVTKDFDGQIASTGFAVLSTKDFKTDPYFLYLLLGTDLVTKQLVRITSGGLYPAISEDELMNIFIPIIDNESQKEIGIGIKTYFKNLINSKQLIAEAKQEVEDLIEGKFVESKISEGV